MIVKSSKGTIFLYNELTYHLITSFEGWASCSICIDNYVVYYDTFDKTVYYFDIAQNKKFALYHTLNCYYIHYEGENIIVFPEARLRRGSKNPKKILIPFSIPKIVGFVCFICNHTLMSSFLLEDIIGYLL
jgi:hypothetical protein